MITTEHQDFLAAWLCGRIGLVPTPNLKCIGSVNRDNTVLRGVIGYDGYNGASVLMHMAGEPGWLDKRVLFAAFDYPFNQMGCNQVLAMVPSGNAVALSINQRLGFSIVVDLEHAHPDGSLVLMRMLAQDCKWLIPRQKH